MVSQSVFCGECGEGGAIVSAQSLRRRNPEVSLVIFQNACHAAAAEALLFSDVLEGIPIVFHQIVDICPKPKRPFAVLECLAQMLAELAFDEKHRVLWSNGSRLLWRRGQLLPSGGFAVYLPAARSHDEAQNKARQEDFWME